MATVEKDRLPMNEQKAREILGDKVLSDNSIKSGVYWVWWNGSGDDELAYIQYWGGECIRGYAAIKEQIRMKELEK